MSSFECASSPALQATTREQLLDQCQEVPVRKVPLLRRHFKALPTASAATTCQGSSETDGTAPQTNGVQDKGQGVPSRGSRVRVMVWNILADALSQGKDNFIKCPKDSLLWENRKYAVLEEILTYDPDIVCLQEVDHYNDFFLPVLKQVGYDGVFKPKPDSPCLDCIDNSGPDGCVVFYKANRFKAISSDFPLLEVDFDGRKVVSNQVAVMQRLRCVSRELPEGEEFCIATTHLKAKRGFETMRAKQGQHLIDLLKECSKDTPVIIGGDFNAEPTENVYSVFESSDLNLESAYKKLSEDGSKEPPYTTWKIRPRSEECHTIDYIWYTKEHFEPVALLHFPGEEEIGSGRLPSWSYPSDHLSLVCDFVFKST